MSETKIYSPIATGSTEPRDIRDRLADFVNLKDFGAKGDGVTNDSAAWNAWQTALQNGGLPFIPKSSYKIGNTVVQVPVGHFGINRNTFTYNDDEIVFSMFTTNIYVDSSNGNDDNDGLIPNNPIKTIKKALEICSKSYIPESNVNIYLAGGTYNEGHLVFDNINVTITILGDITTNCSFEIINYAKLLIQSQDTKYTLYVTYNDEDDLYPVFDVTNNSFIIINNCDLSITLSKTPREAIFLINLNSLCDIGSNCNINFTYTVSNVDAFLIARGSFLYGDSPSFSVTGNIGGGTFLHVIRHGVCAFTGESSVNYSVSRSIVEATSGSFVAWPSVTVNGNVGSIVRSLYDSYVFMDNLEGDITISSSANAIYTVSGGTYISIADSKTLKATLDNASTFIHMYGGRIDFGGSGTCKLLGSTSNGTVNLARAAEGIISSSLSFSGSTLTGTRYKVFGGCYLSVVGAGANRIPGNAAGSVASTGVYE